MTGASNENRTGTAVTTLAAPAETVTPPTVRYDMPFVTQLIAGAQGLPKMPRRRRSERVEVMNAYTHATSGQPARTRRII